MEKGQEGDQGAEAPSEGELFFFFFPGFFFRVCRGPESGEGRENVSFFFFFFCNSSSTRALPCSLFFLKGEKEREKKGAKKRDVKTTMLKKTAHLEVPVVHRAVAVGDERALGPSHPALLGLRVVVDQVVDLGLGRAEQRRGQATLRLVDVVLHLVDREALQREARVGQERDVAEDREGDLENADVEAAEEDRDGDVGDREDVGDVLFRRECGVE